MSAICDPGSSLLLLPLWTYGVTAAASIFQRSFLIVEQQLGLERPRRHARRDGGTLLELEQVAEPDQGRLLGAEQPDLAQAD